MSPASVKGGPRPPPPVAESRRSKEVDAFVAKTEPPVRNLVKGLRQLVLDTAPELQEAVKWSFPTYTLQGNVCNIVPYTKHVILGFFRGTDLADPRGLLEGTGKNLRHVKVRVPKDIGRPAVRALIREAVATDLSAK